MSDIFREVEEDVRRERLEKLWKQNGDYVIAAVAVIVVGVGGYKLWQHYEAQQQMKASAAYAVAQQLGESGRNDQAAQAFATIAKHAPSGYALTAKLAEADALLAAGKQTEAVALYKSIAEKNSADLGDVARIRAAWALADSATRSDLQAMLAPVNDAKSSWRFMAREILAYCDFRNGALKQAQSEYDGLVNDPNTPSVLRQRARAMISLIRTGGGKNYGTVPPRPAQQPTDKSGSAPQ